MKESMEFGKKRYGAKVWVDVPEIRMVTMSLDIYKMFDYLLFPFEDAERKGYCTLVVADLVTMRARGFIPLLYYDVLGKFVRDDVSNVVSIIKGDRKNKDLEPKNMKIQQIRSTEMVNPDSADSALYCMFHAHNLLLKLEKEEADDSLLFRTATQEWFRKHMADELEHSTVMAFSPDGQQPVDITPGSKKTSIPLPTLSTADIPRDASPRAPLSPVRSTPFSRSASPSPRSSSPLSPPGELRNQQEEQKCSTYVKLEQLLASPAFNTIQQRMLNLLARNPEQILYTRPVLVNDQLCPSVLATRQTMQMVPGNVMTEQLFNWYCGLLQDAAKKNQDWRKSIIFTPEVFSAWRAKKNIAETGSVTGTSNPFTPDVVTLFPVCESALSWSLLVARTQPGPGGLTVNLLFFDPNLRFNASVLDDCVSLVRTFYVSRGGDANRLTVSTRKVELPEDCCSPEPIDCAVEIISVLRSVLSRDKIGMPKRLLPAFRVHIIRELLSNDIIPLN